MLADTDIILKLAAQSESKVSSKKRKRLEKYIVRQNLSVPLDSLHIGFL